MLSDVNKSVHKEDKKSQIVGSVTNKNMNYYMHSFHISKGFFQFHFGPIAPLLFCYRKEAKKRNVKICHKMKYIPKKNLFAFNLILADV